MHVSPTKDLTNKVLGPTTADDHAATHMTSHLVTTINKSKCSNDSHSTSHVWPHATIWNRFLSSTSISPMNEKLESPTDIYVKGHSKYHGLKIFM